MRISRASQLFLVMLYLFLSLWLSAAADLVQDNSLVYSVLQLLGLDDVSELPEDDFRRFERLAGHPLPLNSASRSALSASSLFTSYQVEMILDYRSRCGDIVSLRELSLIDGFNPSFACLIEPFVSFAPSSAPGESSSRGWNLDAQAGTQALFSSGAFSLTPSAKAAFSVRTGVGEFGAATAYKHGNPLGMTASFESDEVVQKVVAGNFNARFGQGLSQWSGLSFDAFSTPSALMKRPSGISAYSGWSPQYAMFGAAATLIASYGASGDSGGSFSMSPFADFRGMRFGANAQWLHRHGNVGATVFWEKAGGVSATADFQHSHRGMVFYGEAGYVGGKVNAAAGIRGMMGVCDAALRLSGSSETAGLSAALSYTSYVHDVSTGFSAVFSPVPHGHTPAGALSLKATISYVYGASGAWRISLRLNSRLRTLTPLSDPSAPYSGSWNQAFADLRHETRWNSGSYEAFVRLDGVYSMSSSQLVASHHLGGLACIGGQMRGRVVRLRAQAALFLLDDYNSRLYLYQADVPGTFATVALWGRGYSLSALLETRVCRWMKLYLKTAFCSWPWMREEQKRYDMLDLRLCAAFSL